MKESGKRSSTSLVLVMSLGYTAFSKMLNDVVGAWRSYDKPGRCHPYGERLHGPLWSIASDGDPKCRPALYLHYMVRELTADDALSKPLFSLVGALPGLNLWTGSGGETQDLDYKYDTKRKFLLILQNVLC